jgi:hypothetical protein
MLLPAEVEARLAIPILRAMIARRLIGEYKLKQEEAAKLLGVTQAAISNYMRGTRGSYQVWEKVEEVKKFADEIADMLVSNADMVKIVNKFNEACMYIRGNKLLCELHKRLEANIDTNSCDVCNR